MNKKELKARMKELAVEMEIVRGKLEQLKQERFPDEPTSGTVLKWKNRDGELYSVVRDGDDWVFGSFNLSWDRVKEIIGSDQCWRMEIRSEIRGSVGHGDH